MRELVGSCKELDRLAYSKLIKKRDINCTILLIYLRKVMSVADI